MRALLKQAVRKTAAGFLAGCMTLSLILGAAPMEARAAEYGRNGTMRDISSPELVEDMGLGYNIGNTFDSLGSYIQAETPLEYQRGWGNDPITQHFINQVKAAGFKTIRLPVSWAQWMDGENNVDPVYLDAIQEVVDWCLDLDMYVILNVHHDGGTADTSWIRNAGQDYEGVTEKYRKLWTQIAGRFVNYGDHLILESMNEVAFEELDLNRQYEILNSMNQIFVDTVRATGGNNATRHLLIAGYNTDITRTCDRRYQMPQDPAGHLILSIHYYSPPLFCVATRDIDWGTPITTWGTEEDLAQVRTDLDKLAKRFTTQGIPVIIGEYGVLTEDDKETESIRNYLREVPRIILEYGMCPVLWDSGNSGDMKFIERISGEFRDPVIRANYQTLSAELAAGQVNRHNYDIPTYKQVQAEVSPDGWVSISSYNPQDILGIRFRISCSSSWDSYGGGGLYIDGWDNTPNWQFNSVYDEVEYIFTDAERARLQDRIGIQIWWTDESQGGNHRDELSVEEGSVTLLYAEDTSVAADGTRLVSSPGGGSSGGGGGGGGGGGSRRPNHSTNPAPSGDDDTTDGVRTYEYVLTADRSAAAEDDQTTGVQQLDLAELCPGYKIGDTVRITVTPRSDGGYSYALQAVENGSWNTSDSWGSGSSNSWECTPDDGTAAVYLWYMGGSYFMFNVSVEVTRSAPEFEEIPVENGETLAYDLNEILTESEIDASSRLMMTVGTRAAVEGETYEGTVSFTDVNGVRVSVSISNENPTVTLYGVPEGTEITVEMTSGNAVISSIAVQEAEEGETEEEQPLMQIAAGATAVFPEAAIEEGPVAEEGQESGLKIYVENSAGLSGVVMANGDWNLHMGYSETNLLTDEAGTYIWYPLEDAGSVSQLSLTSYWSDQPLKVLNVVAVAEEVEALAEIAETQVQVDLSEHLATAETEQGETAGIKVYLEAEGNYNGRIILNSWASAPEYNNELLQEDEDGSYIFCEYSEEITNVEIVAYYLQTPPLYVTKLAIVEETEEAEEPLAEITETQVQIDLSEHLADAETEQGETAGIKVYLEAEGNYNGRIILNSWASAPEYNNEVLQEDEDGSYIFCEYSEEITNVEIVAYYLQTPPLYVTKLVLVEETGETEEPLAELSATGATESLVEYLENADRESGEEAGVKIYLEGQGSYNGAIILNNDWNNTVGYSNSELASDEEGNYVFCGYENLDELQQLDIVAYYLESGSVYVTKLVIVESQETQQQPVEQLSLMNELMEEEIPTATNSNALQSDTLQEPIEPVKEETEADSTPDIPEASKPEDQFPPTEDENQKQEQDDNQDSDPEDDVTSSDETEDTGEADEEGEKDEEISKDDSQEPDSETGSQDAQENETSEEDDTESDDVQEGETSQDTDTETDDAQETEKEDSDDTGYEDTDTEDAGDADDEDTDSKDTGSQDTASAPDTGSNSGESADDQTGTKDQSGEKGGSDDKEKSEGEGRKDDSDSGRKQESDEKTDEAGGSAE